MDLNFMNDNLVGIIVLACLTLGYVIKNTPELEGYTPYIPAIVAGFGAVSGILVNGLTYEATVYGAISGLASTGLYEAYKHFIEGRDS